jgi:hypothetical protein
MSWAGLEVTVDRGCKGTRRFSLSRVQAKRSNPLLICRLAFTAVIDVLVRDYLPQFSGFAWTTSSSTKDAPRVRFLVEQSRATNAVESEAVCMALQKRVEGMFPPDTFKFDKSVYGASQPNYTPTAKAETFVFTGAPVDVDELLKETPARPPPKKITVAQVDANEPEKCDEQHPYCDDLSSRSCRSAADS